MRLDIILNWRTGLLEWRWVLHYLCVDVGLGQWSPRISGGRDKKRRRKGQFALSPVLWGWQRPHLIPAWYTQGCHQSCAPSAWNRCVFLGCEMHRALPANWGHRDSSHVLWRTCSSIPLFTSHKGCTTRLPAWHCPAAMYEVVAMRVMAENHLLQEGVSFLNLALGTCQKCAQNSQEDWAGAKGKSVNFSQKLWGNFLFSLEPDIEVPGRQQYLRKLCSERVLIFFFLKTKQLKERNQ